MDLNARTMRMCARAHVLMRVCVHVHAQPLKLHPTSRTHNEAVLQLSVRAQHSRCSNAAGEQGAP